MRIIAASAVISKGSDTNLLKAPLGNDEISIVIDSESCHLLIEVTNASRFVILRNSVSTREQVRHITGNSN